MRSKRVFAGLAAVAATLFAGPAFAGAPYTVSVNGDTSGADHAFTATSAGPVTFTTGSLSVTCSGIQLSGDIHTGTSVANPFASITGSTWTSCLLASPPSVVTVIPDHTPAWTVNGTGNATTSTTDDITGDLSGLKVTVSVMSGLCTFDITGSTGVVYQESLQTMLALATGSGLVVSNVSFGCGGQVSNGDPVNVVETFSVTSTGPVYLS